VVIRNTPPHLKVVLEFKERNLKHWERGRTQIGLGPQTTLKLTQFMHTHSFTFNTHYNISCYIIVRNQIKCNITKISGQNS